MQIDLIYQEILKEVVDSPLVYDTPKYGGVTSKMYIHKNNGYVTFNLDPAESFPLITVRDIGLKVFIAEMIWYLSGSKDPAWLQKYTKIWDAFADDDGLVRSSYGYRWRNHFGRDQIQEMVDLLGKDKTNRQAVIVTWDPAKDGLNTPKQKNVPCVPMIQCLVLDGKLVLNLLWRSNDLYLGFPHDIAGFSLLQAILAQKMGLQVGTLHYMITHAHLYGNQLQNANLLINTQPNLDPIKLDLPKNSYDIARDGSETEKDDLYEAIFANLKSQYRPVQKLKRVKIVV